MNKRSGHLNGERIQAFLDDRLPAEEQETVRAHLDQCDPCRTEYEAWESVFARIEGVSELAPSPGFAARVLEHLPGHEPVGKKFGDWFRALLPSRRRPPGHLEPELVLGYLDRALSGPPRARVESHLDGCAACRQGVSEWRRIFDELEGLERFAPSEGFAEAVLSRVRAPSGSPARPEVALPGRLGDWIGGLRPRTGRGWALVGGTVAAPAVAIAVGALALFSHPLLTPAGLGTFLWWQVTGAARALLGAGLRSAMESPLLLRIWEAMQVGAEAPALVGASILVLSAMTIGAVWILYRNLISTSRVERGHASVSI